jgi:ankyrin repeat protein
MFGSSLYLAASNSHDEIVDAIFSAGIDVNALREDRHSPLFAAIKSQNKRVTEILIRAGAILNPESESWSGCVRRGKVSGNILIAAIQWGDHTLIKNLVEASADVNAFGNATEESFEKCSCITPLTAAVMRRDFYLINYLISAGAEVDPGCDCDPNIRTTLSAAVIDQDLELVDFLLRAGANP